MDYKKITKDMKLRDVQEVIEFNGLPKNRYGLLVIGMLLQSCDYIIIEGFGPSANLKCIKA